jgi:hypothetical protein
MNEPTNEQRKAEYIEVQAEVHRRYADHVVSNLAPLLKEIFAPTKESLRDMFAAAALQGMLAKTCDFKAAIEVWENSDKAAKWAYEYADAMLNARREPQNGKD